MRKAWIILGLLVLFWIVRETRTSNYSCSSTDHLLTVQAQGAQCMTCDGRWNYGDCVSRDGTRGTVTFYNAHV